ncbi:MFS transporter [Streptomyces spinosirectus]|jgi:EmrB/QacA subfamily drug resistance transporter|uniref:MFS transporter n=1 Tax=Streptomyces TaxID=1883 RepID=UPI000D36FD1B|nr:MULTISPECIES: MFS transporter [Streptomyces]MBY8338552.1 MFS transporter [Streptomyces plumbidurans]PTM96872.1 EmrB/QacA subfamily drug resistance transporter [Streptomyces sp. VMFN-G11Ma]UIR16432.1 MFS transporter [Streptomyces spinosirectus]
MPIDTPQTQSAASQDDGAAPRHWWILAVIAVAQLMVVLDATIVNIALPSAQRDLGFSDADRQWVVTAYSLAFGSLLLIGGRLADLLGHKIVFLVGATGFAVSSALAGAADSFTLLVCGRALQGVFGAVLAPAALSLLNITFPEGKPRARAFGIFGAIAGAGGAIGLLLGGVLTEHLNWRWTLYVNLVFAVIAVIGGVLLLDKRRHDDTARLDIPGTLLVSAGLFGIVYGLGNADTHGWSSAMTWGFLVLGLVLVAAFGFWQARAANPLLPLRILNDRDRAASFSAILVAASGMFGIFLFLTYYLQVSLKYTPVGTGVAFLPMIAAIVISAQLATNLTVTKVGVRVAVPTGMALAAVGMVWLTNIGLDTSYNTHVLPPLLVIGLGLGHVVPPALGTATAGVGRDDAGAASAATNTMQQIGGSIGTALLNTIATSAVSSYLKGKVPSKSVLAQAQLHSYTTAFWWAAGIFGLGALCTGLLYRSRSHDTAPDAEPVSS